MMKIFTEQTQEVKKRILEAEPGAVQFADRMAKQLAIIYTTVVLLNIIWEEEKIKLNEKGILDFMLEHINIAPDSQGELALEALREYIAENKRKFILHKDNRTIEGPEHTDTLGKIGWLDGAETGYNSEVSIPVDRMESILKDKGFTNIESIIDDWKGMGILNGEGKKTTRRRTINGSEVRCYVLRLKDQLVDDKVMVSDMHESAALRRRQA